MLNTPIIIIVCHDSTHVAIVNTCWVSNLRVSWSLLVLPSSLLVIAFIFVSILFFIFPWYFLLFLLQFRLVECFVLFRIWRKNGVKWRWFKSFYDIWIYFSCIMYWILIFMIYFCIFIALTNQVMIFNPLHVLKFDNIGLNPGHLCTRKNNDIIIWLMSIRKERLMHTLKRAREIKKLMLIKPIAPI